MPDDVPSRPTPFVGKGPNGQITDAEARALLDELARSGMKLRDFALERGLKPQRLSWWKSKFAGKLSPRAARRSHSNRSQSPAAPRLLPVVVTHDSTPAKGGAPSVASATPRSGYELVLGSARTLRIPHDFQDDSLARLLRLLQEAP